MNKNTLFIFFNFAWLDLIIPIFQFLIFFQICRLFFEYLSIRFSSLYQRDPVYQQLYARKMPFFNKKSFLRSDLYYLNFVCTIVIIVKFYILIKMKTLMFPGQGSQSVGMGADLYKNFELVKKIF